MEIGERLRKDITKRDIWMYSTLPYQIAYGPIGTIIALFILDLHGTVIDVSYAMAAFYLVSIIASVFWGWLIDVYNSRKVFVFIAYASVAAVLAAMAYATNIDEVIALFGVLSFFTASAATPLSLLVMETIEKKLWARGFSKLQMLGSIGGSFGLLVASVVAGFLPLRILMLMLIPFIIASLIIAFAIKEPQKAFKRREIIENRLALRVRLMMHNLLFIRLPNVHFIKSIFLPRGPKKMQDLTLLYIALFAFYLGSGIFNTAYVPGLRKIGLLNIYVFAVIFGGYAVQTIAFYLSGRYTEANGERMTIMGSLWLRAAGYIAIGLVFVLVAGYAGFIVNLLIYAITAGLAFAIFYTASNTLLFDEIGSEKRGRKLGVYSGVVGLGYLLGSVIAGYAAFFIGYWFAFAVSGALVICSIAVFRRFYRGK
ncbi:MAG: MFS transporter [Candidatus Micrarchaeia archaeon]